MEERRRVEEEEEEEERMCSIQEIKKCLARRIRKRDGMRQEWRKGK